MYYFIPILFVLVIVCLFKKQKLDLDIPDYSDVGRNKDINKAKKMVGGKARPSRKTNKFPRWGAYKK